MKKDMKFQLAQLKAKFKKVMPLVNKHAAFAATTAVLIIYLLVVWHISSLATAEPSVDQTTTADASSVVPKVDSKAIQQIQSLEQNSVQVQALFNAARNNPFHE